jgi:hypothetical protein
MKKVKRLQVGGMAADLTPRKKILDDSEGTKTAQAARYVKQEMKLDEDGVPVNKSSRSMTPGFVARDLEKYGVDVQGLLGKVHEDRGLKKGGKVSASKRADGIAQRGKTKGRFV